MKTASEPNATHCAIGTIGPVLATFRERIKLACRANWPGPTVIADLIAEYAARTIEEKVELRIDALPSKGLRGERYLFHSTPFLAIRWSDKMEDLLLITFFIIGRNWMGFPIPKQNVSRSIREQHWYAVPKHPDEVGHWESSRAMTSEEFEILNKWLAIAE